MTASKSPTLTRSLKSAFISKIKPESCDPTSTVTNAFTGGGNRALHHAEAQRAHFINGDIGSPARPKQPAASYRRSRGSRKRQRRPRPLSRGFSPAQKRACVYRSPAKHFVRLCGLDCRRRYRQLIGTGRER